MAQEDYPTTVRDVFFVDTLTELLQDIEKHQVIVTDKDGRKFVAISVSQIEKEFEKHGVKIEDILF